MADANNMRVITITYDTSTPANAETLFFRAQRRTMEYWASRLNRHELAIVLITAFIDYGINTGRRIIKAMETLGFHPSHVAIVLKTGTGSDPTQYRWQRDEDGVYFTHFVPAPSAGIQVPPPKPHVVSPRPTPRPQIDPRSIRVPAASERASH